jgi:hypothetical protein
MQDMESRNFEDHLKDSFKDAEVTPSENVWTNVELDLAKAEGQRMQRRIVFFKMVAAASVIFAMAVAGGSLYVLRSNNSGLSKTTLTAQEKSNQIEKTDANGRSEGRRDLNEANSAADKTEKESATDNPEQENLTYNSLASTTDKTLPEGGNNNSIQHSGKTTSAGISSGLNSQSFTGLSNNTVTANNGLNDRELDRNRLSGIAPKKRYALQIRQQEVDPVEAMLAKLAQREAELNQTTEKEDKRDNKNESLWTSVGFAAGSFNTVSSNVSQPSTFALADNVAIADKEAKASGMTYTMGLNVGTKLSDRWVLQGGVNYLSQASQYQAQAAISTADFQSFRPASTNELEKLSQGDARASTKVVNTAPYDVNNNLSYLSVPVQAGYMIVNRKFGVQLNGGVSTDLFLKNTKTTDAENLSNITQGRGEDSPYRPVNFSGLFGTELSYRFARHYRVAINPGVRYPFSSIYKSDIGVQSTPLTFDVGLRFRYIFH